MEISLEILKLLINIVIFENDFNEDIKDKLIETNLNSILQEVNKILNELDYNNTLMENYDNSYIVGYPWTIKYYIEDIITNDIIQDYSDVIFDKNQEDLTLDEQNQIKLIYYYLYKNVEQLELELE